MSEALEHYQVQYDRLVRHYEILRQSSDRIAMLDMATTLRNWVDMKEDLNRDFQSVTRTLCFQRSAPSKELKRLGRDGQNVFVGFQDGVAVAPRDMPRMAGMPEINGPGDCMCSFIQRGAPGEWVFGDFLAIPRGIGEEQFSKMLGDPKYLPFTRLQNANLYIWLQSDCVLLTMRNSDGELEKFNIPRQILIRRVGAGYGALHPKRTGGPVTDNRFDPPIKWLFDFHYGDIPLPYFILLGIAQELVIHIPKIIPGIVGAGALPVASRVFKQSPAHP